MTEKPLRETFGNFLVEKGRKNKDIVVLDADLSTSTKVNRFGKVFPERFFSLGIAEQNMLGTALGFAISGKVPIVSGFSIFTTGRAWEFIRFASHDNLNVKIITTHGGIVGEDGSTHSALEDISLLATLPNLSILVPSDNIELKEMLEYSLETDGPYYIRLPRGTFPPIHDEQFHFSIGRPEELKNGEDLCIIGIGYGTSLALNSVHNIEKEFGITIKVLNLSTIKPILINALIEKVKNVKAIIIIEEHNIYCGVGSIVAKILSEFYPIPIQFIGINDCYIESGNRENLLEKYGLSIEMIRKKVEILFKST